SSDSVPVHLLTKEAIQLYLKKLAKGGIIVVNIANRYLDFKPVFGNLADDLHLASLWGRSLGDDADENLGSTADLYGCGWVLLARDPKDFGSLNELKGGRHGRAYWYELPRGGQLGVWTDDFSNLLGVFDWGEAKR